MVSLEKYRRTAKIGRYKLSYLQKGRGKPLVFLHGFLGSSYSFRHVFEELSLKNKLIVPDLPGCGQSSKPPRLDYMVGTQMSIVMRLLEQLKLKEVIIGGVSTGGAVALNFALEYPRMLKKLILVDSFGLKFQGRERRTLFGIKLSGDIYAHLSDPEQLAKVYQRQFNQKHRPTPEDREMFTQQSQHKNVIECAAKMLNSNRMFEVFGIQRIETPTLVVWGERDKILPKNMAERYVRVLPDARYVMIPEAGHLPHEESPEDFLTVVRGFIEDSIPSNT
ncbi:MAG: alpha/beta fold hydrolase [candidate division Zixibacteria bacterium]|nr:alpha/beta fold hydrolase [candidate division Zixibacteria bacterium]